MAIRSAHVTIALPLLCAAVLSTACGDEKLRSVPYQGPPPGGVIGRLCDRTTGEWVDGATITTEDGSVVTSDADGYFELEGLEPGSYTLTVEGEDYSGERVVIVQSGETTDIRVTSCQVDFGQINGRACDEPAEAWVPAADVTLTLPTGDETTVTDEFGRFSFADVPVGTHQVAVRTAAFEEIYDVTVAAFQTAWAGDVSCGPMGAVSGRICGGGGYWLSGARVFVDLVDGTAVETSTDGDGYFTLAGVPSGTQTVEVSRGSFYTSFDVDVIGNDTVTMPDPVCIPPTTRMAVISGVYDHVDSVLTDLGFPIGTRYSAGGPIQQNVDGNVDIIDGETGYWVTDFLTDPAWMADYDILFFNCGLDDWEITSGSSSADAAIANIQSFVAAGGSIYASDWASEVVRLAFPGRVNFYGDDSAAGAARVGASDTALGANVVDAGLQTSLGSGVVTVNLDLDAWVVMEPVAAQPSDVQIMLVADIDIFDDLTWETLPQADTPLLLHFQQGFGRVLYTSVHNEAQTTQDLRDVLNYSIFEL